MIKKCAVDASNLAFIEWLQERYLVDKSSVDESWVEYFKQDENLNKSSFRSAQLRVSAFPGASLQARERAAGDDVAYRVVEAFRSYGHTAAKLDPLAIKGVQIEPYLLNLINSKLEGQIECNGLLGLKSSTYSQLIEKASSIYSGTLAYEFRHVSNKLEEDWLYNIIEGPQDTTSSDERKKFLLDITEASMFEEFLHSRFPGAKRFSIEGAEAYVASIEFITNYLSVTYQVNEIVLGMAHRGRLCTLTKVLKVPYRFMFAKFHGVSEIPEELNLPSDVKYHMGASVDRNNIQGYTIHLSLLPNPSHLEAVNSVVLGKTRAKQKMFGKNAVPILIHGDASFSGQGSAVYEALALSGLNGYKVDGTIHIVINNQIGFTANPEDSRSTKYCTDIAKSICAPIIHVNGDDIEAVIRATRIACDYRERFKKDVVIDLVCYRKYGHNEGDEPKFTQPLMYDVIQKKKTVSELYSEILISNGVISNEDFNNIKSEISDLFTKEFEASKNYKPQDVDWFKGAIWNKFVSVNSNAFADNSTGVDVAKLKELGACISKAPQNFNLNAKVDRQLESRRGMFESGEYLDWGAGEALAFASLLDEGFNVRLTGQDSKRGTFSHRHAVLFDQINQSEYIPLNNIKANQKAYFEVHSSNLSEFGVLGFEYGYSITDPNTLTIWEAQFGDFANGAQTIIDQYIASGEAKWLRSTGLVMLLPHAYEGQGPEHSSARLERFLQLAACNNMQVVNCTTPASLFHSIRRQVHRNYRIPLVVMSPKSLLRHKAAVSSMTEMGFGTLFSPVIPDPIVSSAQKVVFCSGKIYYDLLEQRSNRTDIALIRLEQLYPFPEKAVAEQLLKYKDKSQIIWCQEEHRNMGAYSFIREKFNDLLKKDIVYIGRDESSSPAAGYSSRHVAEQKMIMEELFGN
ncbi:2-oxoglutarate dehydrogenase E1 component [Candidatus Cyrtobacter comes]|uniref:2-oxoglutarate dehydrogenase E1 component n=2 Tax=Candidatus Cyrtobacter comes TaxID=675776 RepID=A0ABU5L6Z6_9RICK|nr:2-oxoglutarate dehydrogenase E1 component [Candidatus Cyrtobacter comes]